MPSKLLLMLVLALGAGPDWQLNFDKAKSQASEENKLILLNFSGSDWCAPCIKLTRSVFETEGFAAYAQDHLVLVRADFPRLKKNKLSDDQTRHNEMLAEKYNPQGKFPYTLLLKPDGTVIHEWDGYAGFSTEDFLKQVSKFSE